MAFSEMAKGSASDSAKHGQLGDHDLDGAGFDVGVFRARGSAS